jgi:hypothetical protein
MIFRFIAFWWLYIGAMTIAGVDVGKISIVCACLLAAMYSWKLGDK